MHPCPTRSALRPSACGHLRALGRLFALGLALLLLFPLAGHAQDNDLKTVLDSYRQELRSSHTSLDQLETRLAKKNKQLRRQTILLSKKRDQLVLLFGSAQSPWDLRDVLRGNEDLRGKVRALINSPSSLDKDLSSGLDALQEMEAKIDSRLQESITPAVEADLRGFLDDIHELAGHITAFRAKLSVGLQPLLDLDTALAKEDGKVKEDLKRVWKNYYTEKTPTLFTASLPDWLAYSWQQWLTSVRFTARLLDNDHRDRAWSATVSISLLVSMALALAGWTLSRRLPGRFCPREARPALRWAILCLAAAMGLDIWADNVSQVLFSMVGAFEEILLTAGLVFLSRFLTLVAEGCEAAPKTATRWPLWALFSLGLLLQCLRVPDIFVQPLLAVSLLTLGLWIRRQALSADARLDKALAAFCGVALPVLALGALLGYSRAATLLTSMLFYLVLSVRFSNAVVSLFVSWQASISHKGSPVLMGLLSGVGFPLVFLCIFSLSLWLASSQFEGQLVFMDVLSREVQFEAFAVSAQRLGLVLLGYYLLKSGIHATQGFLASYGMARRDLEPGAVQSLQAIARYVWWACFVIFVLFMLGFSFTSLAVVAGGLSVGIGFGLQQIINNFLSGLILLFGRAVQVGDVLQMGDTLGVVKRVNIRNTIVQTYDNATIFVPNSTLITNQIINWSHRDRRVRRDVAVGVAYGSDRAKVCDLLLRAALSVDDVLRQPAPEVLFMNFGPSALEFVLRVWVPEVDNATGVLSRVRNAVDQLLRDNGVEIAFPQTDIHVRSVPSPEPEPKPAKG